MSQQILELVEKSSLKTEIPDFNIGDTVDVHTKILEGDKERIQVFSGVVIARSGSGSREMFTVRRIVFERRRRTQVPAPFAAHRQDRSQARRRRPTGQALLPPRPDRQVDPPQGTPSDRSCAPKNSVRKHPSPAAGMRAFG